MRGERQSFLKDSQLRALSQGKGDPWFKRSSTRVVEYITAPRELVNPCQDQSTLVAWLHTNTHRVTHPHTGTHTSSPTQKDPHLDKRQTNIFCTASVSMPTTNLLTAILFFNVDDEIFPPVLLPLQKVRLVGCSSFNALASWGHGESDVLRKCLQAPCPLLLRTPAL